MNLEYRNLPLKISEYSKEEFSPFIFFLINIVNFLSLDIHLIVIGKVIIGKRKNFDRAVVLVIYSRT